MLANDGVPPGTVAADEGAEAMANRRAWEEFQRGKFEDIWWQGEG